ncbi:MAG: HMA2 domain-containing protein [Candidatus Ozemobacteraceae bacterium]
MESENSKHTSNGSNENGDGLRVASHVPGRLRLRGVLKFQLESLANEIAGIDGAVDVSYDETLGSILVKYDSKRVPPILFSERLRQIPLLSELESEIKNPREPGNGSEQPDPLGGKVKKTRMQLKARSVIPSFLLIFGVFEAVRSQGLPNWYDVIKESLDEFRHVSKTDIRDDSLIGGIHTILAYLNGVVRAKSKGRFTLASVVVTFTFLWSFLEFLRQPMFPPWIHIFREGLTQIRHQGGLR